MSDPILQELNAVASADLQLVRIHSHRKVLAPVAIGVKRLLKRFLTPILQQQTGINTSLARITLGLHERVLALSGAEYEHHSVAALRDDVERAIAHMTGVLARQREILREQIADSTRRQTEALIERVSQLQEQQQVLRREAARAEVTQAEAIATLQRRHDAAVTSLRDLVIEGLSALRHESRARDSALDGLYAALEDEFRGSRAVVLERARVYLPEVQAALASSTARSVLDLGCGRGEWLELLGVEGVAARGVDTNSLFVADCLRRKLRAEQCDALAHLRSLPSASETVISSIQLVEHLEFTDLVAMLTESARVLEPHGLLILETPNPEHPAVSGHTFYLDPTHRHPLPSALLSFLVRQLGLSDVRIVPLHPAHDVAQDYAILARK